MKTILRTVEWYKGWPKWLRFTLFYGTAPVWMPIAVVGAVVVYLICAAVLGVIEAWEGF